MGIVLGPNRYGKAECRVVRIVRDTPRHEIRDLNVSTSLRGDFAAAHVAGDQSQVLPTDTQKNTAFAYAKKHGVTSPEDYALALARRLLEATPAATGARIRVEEYAWDRIPVDGAGHDHAFVRRGGEVRTTEVDLSSEGAHVVSGLTDLVVLKSTGSEFTGFLVDEYTTLPEAEDRILATSLTATWRYSDRGAVAWNRRTTRCGRCCSPPSRRRTAAPSRRRCTPWDVPCSRRTRGSRRSRSPPPTSTTASWTSSPSASTTPGRSSSPRTGRTG